MKVNDLLLYLIVKEIYIATETGFKYYFIDGGISFREISFKTGVISEPDPELTYKIYNSRVKWVKPMNNYAVYIMIEEKNNDES